jgi:hypothetical protein
MAEMLNAECRMLNGNAECDADGKRPLSIQHSAFRIQHCDLSHSSVGPPIGRAPEPLLQGDSRRRANRRAGNSLRPAGGVAPGPGTAIASAEVLREVIDMFAVSAILVGIVGIFFVRRRSARKKQQQTA